MKKVSILVFVLLVSFPFFDEKVSAALDYEVEPNNNSNEAQHIERNAHNPTQLIDGDTTSQKVLSGQLENNLDEDWYKVTLPKDSETVLSINGSRMSVEVYDSNFSRIFKEDYQRDPSFLLGAYPYWLDIPEGGDYYVRVHNLIGTDGGYRFTIGSPNYSVDSYEYKAPRTLNLTRSIRVAQDRYDLRNIKDVPKEAVVYKVILGGKKVNSARSEYRRIKPSTDYGWTTAYPYSWISDISVLREHKFHNIWDFELGGKVSRENRPYSLTPRITFSYVYPVLPRK